MKFFTKKIITLLFVSLSVILLNGCNSEQKTQHPYLFGQTNHKVNQVRSGQLNAIQVAKLKAQTQKEIALINKQRDVEVEALKQNSSVTKAKITKDVEFKKNDTQIVMMGQTLELEKINAILKIVTLLFISLLFFYFLQKRRTDKLKMHQDLINKDLYIKDRELQAQMTYRLLDTLENKNLTPKQKARLIDSITKTTDIAPQTLLEKRG